MGYIDTLGQQAQAAKGTIAFASSDMKNDALLEIAFDQQGTKRLMANYASAHMKKK